MKHSHVTLLPFCVFLLIIFLCAQARHHSHSKHWHSHSHSHKSSGISIPPASAPSYSTPPPDDYDAPSPSPSPSSNDSGVFDVRKFGAIGDGISDDTEAFKMAWDTACQSDLPENVILVPSGFSFMIQSTIFTGPCQGGMLLKVVVYRLCMCKYSLNMSG